ncbi:MAG TPA: hypothetical protein VGD19_00510 [Allosphingosinicella sp.]
MTVRAGGSVTGLAFTDSADDISGAGRLFAALDVQVTAGPLARLTLVEAGRDATVGAGTVAVGSADAGRNLAATAGSGLHLGTGEAGGTTTLRTGTAGVLTTPIAEDARDVLDTAHGFANLFALDANDQRNTSVTVTAGLATPGADPFGAAQLGTVSAGTVPANTIESATADSMVSVTADRLTVTSASAGNGALLLTAREGALYLGTGTAGTRAVLDKRGAAAFPGNELRARSLTAGTAADAVGATTVVSATDVRLGTLEARGGSIDIRAGEDASGTAIVAPDGSVTLASSRVRDGDVTGLLLAAGQPRSNGLDPDHGRAVLSAVVSRNASGELNANSDRSVSVAAGGLVQLGAVTAGENVSVVAGSANIAGRDGAIDITTATARRGALTLEAYNDDPAKLADVRLGTTHQDPSAVATDPAAGDSRAAGAATLRTRGTRGDVVVGRSLVAGGTVTLDSARDVLLAQAPYEVRSTGGDIVVRAVRDVTGLPAGGTDTGEARVDGGQLRAGTVLAGGDVLIDGAGNVRLREATSTAEDVTVTAGGSATGLAFTDSGDDISGAGRLFAARDVEVTAGPLARLSEVDAGRDVTVEAADIAIGSAIARSGDLSADAGGSGLHLGTGTARDMVTLRTAAPGDLATPATGALGEPEAGDRDVLDRAHGFADLTAAGAVTVGAGLETPAEAAFGAAQLDQVEAGDSITVTADRLTVTSATAADGALALTAREGPLFLDTGSAGTTATLDKQGAAELVGNELRVRTSLTAGTASGSVGDIAIRSATDARLAGGDPEQRIRSLTGSIVVEAAREATGLALAANEGDGRPRPGFGRADLFAETVARDSGGGLLRDPDGNVIGKDVTVIAGTAAQLGTAIAGRNLSSAADRIDVSTATAANGALTLTADAGNLVLGAGSAGTVATIATTGKAADDAASGDVFVTSLVAGTDAGARQPASGDIQIRSVGDARLGDVTSRTGSILAQAAAGEVTGIGTGDNRPLDAPYGRANLAAASSDVGSGVVTGEDVTVIAGTLARLGTVTAGRDVSVTAGNRETGLGGSIDAVTTTAGLDAALDARGGNVTLVDLTAADDIAIRATGAVTAGTLSSGGTIDQTGAADGLAVAALPGNDIDVVGNSLGIGAATARGVGSDLRLTATGGQLTLDAGTAGATATLTKLGGAGELQVTSALTSGVDQPDGDSTIRTSTHARLANVTSRTGAVLVEALAGEATGVGTDGRANLAAEAGSKDVTVRVGTLARLGTATAGRDLAVTAGNSATPLNGSIDVTIARARDVALDARGGNVTAGEATARDDLVVRASGAVDAGALASGTAVGGQGAVDEDGAAESLVAGESPAVSLAGNDLDVRGNSLGIGTAAAQGNASDLRLTATGGQMTLGTGTAGATATLVKQGGAGELQVTNSLTAVGNAALTSSTNQRLGTVTSRTGDIMLAATSGSVTGIAAGADFGAADLDANGRVQLRAGPAGLVRLSDVNATRGDVDVEAGTNGAATSRIEILDTVTAGAAYRVTGGSIALGDDAGAEAQRAAALVAVTATNGAITGGSGLTLQSNSDGAGTESLTLAANGTGGAVTFDPSSQLLGGTASGSDVMVDTVGRAALGQVTATGRTITIGANDLELQGANANDLAPRVTATTVNITNRADVANATRLGNEPEGTAGFDLVQAEVNRIAATGVTIESGTQNVQIGSLALATGVGTTRLNIQTVARIDVSGTVTADGSANTRTVQLGGNAADAANDTDNRRASIIRVASTPSAGGRLLMGDANLDLRGARIGVGRDGDLPDLAGASFDSVANGFISNPNSSLYVSGEPYGEPTILTADTLSVTYSDFALFQNTARPLLEPTGAIIGEIAVNGVLNLTSTGTTAPNGFAIFGQITGRTGSAAALLGPSVIVLNEVNPANTRINGCVIGGGGCLVSSSSAPTTGIPDLSQVSVLGSADDLAIKFDPVIGTNNEALFSSLSSIDPDFDPVDCQADPTLPECKVSEED